MFSYSANIARPGNVPMRLHTYQVGIQPPVRKVAFVLNIMWFLCDIAAENGGTRVFPCSHLLGRRRNILSVFGYKVDYEGQTRPP